MTGQEELASIIRHLQELPLSEVRTRLEADKFLSSRITNQFIRGFLLQNLRNKPKENGGGVDWRVPLDYISQNLEVIMNYNVPVPAAFEGPVLFVGGTQSHYISGPL